MDSHSLLVDPLLSRYRLLVVSTFICFILSLSFPAVALAQDFTINNHLGEVCYAIADERELPQDPDNH
jgi:hypothetical protein